MGFERVRRLNEPVEAIALCEVHECAKCGYTIEGGGMSLGKRWLHLSCVEGFIESLERARDRALADAETARAALSQPPVNFVWSNGGGAAVPAWQPMQYGTTYTITLDPGPGANGGGTWISTGSAMTYQSFESNTSAASLWTPTLYTATATTSGGLEKSLGP